MSLEYEQNRTFVLLSWMNERVACGSGGGRGREPRRGLRGRLDGVAVQRTQWRQQPAGAWCERPRTVRVFGPHTMSHEIKTQDARRGSQDRRNHGVQKPKTIVDCSSRLSGQAGFMLMVRREANDG